MQARRQLPRCWLANIPWQAALVNDVDSAFWIGLSKDSAPADPLLSLSLSCACLQAR